MEDPQDGTFIGRQVGKHFHGAVYRGSTRILGASPIRASASIPSKFETVINVGSKERDGFGNRDHRFTSYETELPGPGNYNTTGDVVWQHDSISKKGTGNFPSTETRFKYKAKFQAPGPGAYDQHRYTGKPDAKHFSKAPSTSVFHSVTKGSGPPIKEPLLGPPLRPGPGQYDPQKAAQKVMDADKSACRSAFASEARRDMLEFLTPPTCYRSPAPGHYNAPSSLKRPPLGGAGTAGFASGTERTGPVKVTGGGAPNVIYGEEGSGAYSEGPAPGDHHSTILDLENKFKHGPAVSSIFGKTTLDRFGHTTQPKVKREIVPGPGTYTVAQTSDARVMKIGAASAFVSATPRLGQLPTAITLARPPGPAFYTADKCKQMDKKEFNLNARKRWL